MRYVTAYVKPFKVDEVIEALSAFPVEELGIEEVRGYGRQKGHLELYTGTEYQITFLPKVKLEFAIAPEHAAAAVKAIEEAARTGRIGDGKVFVRDVRRAVDV